MPPKRNSTTPEISRPKQPRLELTKIASHSTRLAPIPLEIFKKYQQFKFVPDKILKSAKLALSSFLKGDLMEGNEYENVMFAMIVTTEDEVYTWGENLKGDWNILKKVDELCGKGVVDIYASHYSSILFAITASGDVYSWGINERSQLGHSWNRNIVKVPELIDPIHPAQKIVKIATSSFQTYFLTQEGDVFTWGMTPNRKTLMPTQVFGPDGKDLKNIVNIETGREFVVALDQYGKVYFQKKTSNLKNAARMMEMNVPGKVVQISAGFYHMLALTDEGKIIGWGKNSHQQLPPPYFSLKEPFTPKFIQGHLKDLKFTKVAAVASMCAAELEAGDFYMWGDIFINEGRVQKAPFRVPKCTNFDEISTNYCSYVFPKLLRGEHLPAAEENASDKTKNRKESYTTVNVFDERGGSMGTVDEPIRIPNSEHEADIDSESIPSTSAETKIDVKIKLEKKIKCEILENEDASSSSEDQQAASSFTSLSKSTPGINRKKGDVLFKIGNEERRPDFISLKLLKCYAYFKIAMDRNRTEVTINDITAAAFDALIVYLEEDEIPLKKGDFENIISLLTFGDIIEDKELKQKCLELLDINMENSQEIYFSCSEKSLEGGVKLAFDFILKNCKEIRKNKKLHLNRFLNDKYLKDLLKLVEALQ